MDRIEDYALIADTHSAGLVSKTGSIDWLCLPRFDSPSCFAALLDKGSGGRWWIRPRTQITRVERAYVADTMVLETTFHTPDGVATLVDCLALEEESDPTAPRLVKPEEVLVRIVRGVQGRVPMEMHYLPRFDYGGVTPWFRVRHGNAIEAVGGPDALDLVASVPLRLATHEAVAEFDVEAGDAVSFLASYHPSHVAIQPRDPSECRMLMDRTERFWRTWASRCAHEGPWRDAVVRSLLVLKSLIYSPTGGLVAAPTTSLPEKLRGVRNWDYRYCWLRDATFTLDVLLDHGYTEEAREWRDWLLRAVAGDPQELQIMYGVMGERRLPELEIEWLAGYAGSRPVRIGNGAVDQFQLDVYGEVIDSFHSARRAGMDTPAAAWDLEKKIVDFVSAHWREPDEGIWEVRSGRRHFVHSKVMAWVALDRAIQAVEIFGKDGPVDEWKATRAEIRGDVLSKGVDPRSGAFKRSYDQDEPDASLLMVPLVGFLPVDDERVVATIDRIESELMVDGLLRRYRTESADDGLPPGEGTFIMCSFWLVDCLVLVGRRADAERLFDRLVRLANDVGLLSEQYEPTERRLLGNFPQAFSHVALVAGALALQQRGPGIARREAAGGRSWED